MTERVSATGWHVSDRRDFRSGSETTATHSGSECVYLKSIVARPKTFGFLSKSINAEPYLGNQLKMSGWIKTLLPEGASAQLWLRVDGDWKEDSRPQQCFDNMYERRIKGNADWARYEVTVEVPENSQAIVFGVLLNGTGQLWLDDVMLDGVEKQSPLAQSKGQP